MGAQEQVADQKAAGAGLVLFTLCCAQFLMTLDSSVMNVSIATVAEDIGTTITGIQTAITLYTLVMATMMITGGKIGSIIGRRKAFSIGCVIYAAGSLTTALAPNLPVLIFGWSLLEGLGAALIMPAIVALVASNFPAEGRPRAYGLVASAGAIAVAVGPLIGGLVTTYFSWRWVFAAEVLIAGGILLVAKRIKDAPVTEKSKIDRVGVVLSAAGLGMIVFGVLKSGEWGWVQPKAGTEWLGLSPTICLIVAGILVLRWFLRWEEQLIAEGKEPLIRPKMLQNQQLRGGLTMFFFQFFVQAGLFFVVPLFLSVVLGLSALSTGARLLPLSLTLLVAAIGIPKLRPNASPRKVVRRSLFALAAGVLALIGGLEVGAGPEIITVPMLLAGLGIGGLASQLGAITVSSLPDEASGEVGGLQNTLTNLGASLGTALAGSILIGTLTTSFIVGLQSDPAIPAEAAAQAEVELASGIPFVSDADLEEALTDADVPADVADSVIDANEEARIDALRTSLTAVALGALLALFFTQSIPGQPVSGKKNEA